MSDYFVAEAMSQSTDHSALLFALIAQQRSADVGFDFENISLAMKKVQEELSELTEAFPLRDENAIHFAEELGDCFFALVNLCRHSNLNPEELLKSSAEKYLNRCAYVENQLKAQDQSWRDTPLQEIYSMWAAAKN